MKDITGQKFGKLTAIKPMGSSGTRTYWLFKCDCGNEKVLRIQNVVYPSSKTKSCDCVRRNLSEKYHGMGNTRFYSIYRNMRNRCEWEKSPSYKYYGGRGIKCRWYSFEKFRDDMYELYLTHVAEHGERNTTIDRIESDKDYNKENWRWATPLIQSRNRQVVRPISFGGQTMLLTDWANKLEIDKSLLHWRLENWSIEKALTTPVK